MSPALPADNRKSRSALWVCLTSGGLTLLLLLAVYALRGLWPFGPDNVAYVDTAQFYLPGYYKLWDALHGAPMTVSWFSGLAEGGNASLWSLLNPPAWVFLFLPRDRLLEGLSLYLAVYLLEIALVTGLTVGLRFPRLSLLWQTLLTLVYTFSGYTLQYYSNFSWLWIAAIFPPLLLGLERLLRDGKPLLFAALYAYTLFSSVYFAYMVTVYILVFAFAYTVFLLPRELRGGRLLRLGLSAAAALGLSAVFWLADSASLAGTSRFQSNLDSGLMTGFTTWDLTNTRHTLLMLLGTAPAVALLLRALGRQRSMAPERRAARARGIRFFAFVLGALAIPMVFTNIDTAWHFGQYNFFPMRYGFAVPATLLAAAGLCLEEERSAPLPAAPAPGRTAPRLGACVLIAAALALLEPRLTAYFREYGACFLNALGPKEYGGRYLPLLAGGGLLFTALYLLLLRSPRRRTAAWLIAAAVLLQLGGNAFGLIAPSDDHTYTREYDPAYVETADALYEVFSRRDISPLSRAKNVDNSLNAGYPAIAGVSALSSVNSSNSAVRLGLFRELGYTVNYFRLLDTGGTVFSDMLLGVDAVLSAEALDGTLYTDTGEEIAGIHVGRADYPGVLGLTYPAGALDGYFDLLTLPDRLNALYAAFTGSDRALAFAPAAELSAEGEGLRPCALTCVLPTDAFLYMSADTAILNIAANGVPVPVPTYQNTQNAVYPAAFNSNLLYLGRFPAGTVTVSFTTGAALGPEDITLTALDGTLVETFPADAKAGAEVTWDDRSVTVTVTAEEPDRALFLPLTWSARWQCLRNGGPVSAEPVLGTLVSVPLREGVNRIELTRGPARPSFSAGLLISLGTLTLLLVCLPLRRRIAGRALPPLLDRGLPILFYALCGAVFAFIYLAPTALLILRGTVVRF